MISSIRRLGLLAAFVALGASALAFSDDSQIKISRALNSPTLAVKYDGVHVALVELRLNGESFGTRSMDDGPKAGETTFSLDLLALKDGDNDVEIRLYDKDGHLVGSEKTVITTDSNTKGPVFLTTPKMGENVMGPVEISVGFGRDFKNSYVSFFVDNQFKSMMNFPPYVYNWDTTRESNGWHELEAWVVDDTSATFKTRKVRVFVNNPGGRTYRIDPTVTKPAAANPPVMKRTPVVKHPAAIKPAKGVPTLPEPQPIELSPTPNDIAAGTSSIVAPLKPLAHAASALATARTNALPPAILGFVVENRVLPHLEGRSAGLKPAPMPDSLATGLRVLTPTGKRVVAVKTQPQAAAPVAKIPASPSQPVAKQAPKATPAQPELALINVSPSGDISSPAPQKTADSKPVASPAVTAPTLPQPPKVPAAPAAPVQNAKTEQSPAADIKASSPDLPGNVVALMPASHTEAAVIALKPMNMDVSGEGMVRRPVAPPIQPEVPKPTPETATPVTAAELSSLASTDSVVKKAPAPKVAASRPAHHAKLLAIEYGTRLPNRPSYSIVYNGTPLAFDVAPSIEQGVPVTPFRHLIEHAGGTVTWQASDHEVEASTDGRDIWLKIGDKVAKINSLSVNLELAPFLRGGRTIVPLSFIESALNVTIDYDKATGHVLITPKQ